jgi:hypothetical protein
MDEIPIQFLNCSLQCAFVSIICEINLYKVEFYCFRDGMRMQKRTTRGHLGNFIFFSADWGAQKLQFHLNLDSCHTVVFDKFRHWSPQNVAIIRNCD